MTQRSSGFTLLEILIALAVFAILASLTAYTMNNAFTTRKRITAQAEQLITMELAVTMISRDTEQAVTRPVRGEDMRLFPIFVGQSTYMEFTRGGLVNPGSEEKRSTLKRVAYLCNNHRLIRRTWERLDTIDRKQRKDTVLLEKLKDCQFAYLDRRQQILEEWRSGQAIQDENGEPLPKAVRINLTPDVWGEVSLLYILPKALYAPTIPSQNQPR